MKVLCHSWEVNRRHACNGFRAGGWLICNPESIVEAGHVILCRYESYLDLARVTRG